jgi:protein transport protein SEC31
MQRVKARAPSNYRQHVVDTEKRLNILFDHLNNEDLLKPDTIQSMNELASNIQARQYDDAIAIFSDLMTNKTDEGSNWLVSPRIYKLLCAGANSDIGWCETIDSVR